MLTDDEAVFGSIIGESLDIAVPIAIDFVKGIRTSIEGIIFRDRAIIVDANDLPQMSIQRLCLLTDKLSIVFERRIPSIPYRKC